MKSRGYRNIKAAGGLIVLLAGCPFAEDPTGSEYDPPPRPTTPTVYNPPPPVVIRPTTPPTTPTQTPPTQITPTQFLAIPGGHYYGENLRVDGYSRLGDQVLFENHTNDGLKSISFDSDGFPLNYDDKLQREVRIYPGYFEESEDDLLTVKTIKTGVNTHIDYDIKFFLGDGKVFGEGTVTEDFILQSNKTLYYVGKSRIVTEIEGEIISEVEGVLYKGN